MLLYWIQPSVKSWLFLLSNWHLQHLPTPLLTSHFCQRECEVPRILMVLGSLSHQGCWWSHQESQEGLFCLWGNGSIPRKTKPSLSLAKPSSTRVVPVLLHVFGGENWILTDSQLNHLEAFQGEIGRRILKLSKSHFTLATRVALKLPSVAARILT